MDYFIDGNKYIFTTQRLVLRPLCVGDLKTAHKYACDVENTKYMMFLPNKTESETLAFLQSVEKEWSKPVPRSYEFAICLNGRHIGAIGIYLESDESGELGWILNRDYHGQGYCTEAAMAVLDFAGSLGLKRVTAHCDTRNVASYRVMEKIGMTRVGEGDRRYFDERGAAREYEYCMDLKQEISLYDTTCDIAG